MRESKVTYSKNHSEIEAVHSFNMIPVRDKSLTVTVL